MPSTAMCRQAAPASQTMPPATAVITAALPMSGCSSRIRVSRPASSSGLKVSKKLLRMAVGLAHQVAGHVQDEHQLHRFDHLEVEHAQANPARAAVHRVAEARARTPAAGPAPPAGNISWLKRSSTLDRQHTGASGQAETQHQVNNVPHQVVRGAMPRLSATATEAEPTITTPNDTSSSTGTSNQRSTPISGCAPAA